MKAWNIEVYPFGEKFTGPLLTKCEFKWDVMNSELYSVNNTQRVCIPKFRTKLAQVLE